MSGHWVLKGVTHFTQTLVCVFILVAGSDPAFSRCCKTSFGVFKTGLGATPSLGDSDTAVNTVGKALHSQRVSTNLPAPDLILNLWEGFSLVINISKERSPHPHMAEEGWAYRKSL